MNKLIYTIKDNVIVVVYENTYEVVIYNQRPLYMYQVKEKGNGDAINYTKSKADKELVVEVLSMFLDDKHIDRIKKHIKLKEVQ